MNTTDFEVLDEPKAPWSDTPPAPPPPPDDAYTSEEWAYVWDVSLREAQRRIRRAAAEGRVSVSMHQRTGSVLGYSRSIPHYQIREAK